MDKKNKIILITISILVVIVLVFVFSIMFSGKNKELNPNIENVVVEDLKNVVGKVVSVEISQIKIRHIDGSDMTLKIPERNVTFYRQFQQEENEFLNEEIGLFDIKEGDEVQIQYNNKTNEALLITVKE